MESLSDRELDELIKGALHHEAERLAVSGHFKEHIEKETVIKTYLGAKDRSNFATICLNLFESIEATAKQQNITIRCLPSDDAFVRSVALENYVLLALEYVFSKFVMEYGLHGSKVLIFTEENAICIEGLNISALDFTELCAVGEKTYTINQSDMGIAISFLQLRGISVKTSENNNVQIIFD